MLNNTQQSRLARRFTQFDRDGSDYVEENDMKLMADNVCAKLIGDDKHASLRAEVHEGYRALWQALEAAADTDGDHKISKEEFADAWGNKLLNDEKSYKSSVERIVSAGFEAVDTDTDGVVDRATFDRFCETFGMSREDITAIADGGDRFNLDACHDAIRQYHLGKAQPTHA